MVKMGLALDFYPHFSASLGARCPFQNRWEDPYKKNLENRCPISRFIVIGNLSVNVLYKTDREAVVSRRETWIVIKPITEK